MKLKDHIINFLFYSMLLALLGFWWCQLNDTVQKYHSKYVEVQHQAQQAYDIQMQATIRIKALEDKVSILERNLADLQVAEINSNEDELHPEMVRSDSSGTIKWKIQATYDKVFNNHEGRIAALESGLAGLGEAMANMTTGE